ncbi:hypothetical protein ASF61_08675 [Duganella sp. Leaf126]|uniref:lysozyme inhibitor LprI family protein n=1 Tax=Duganella sp. Leaf126 TaxID=1736266 RepID=UPI0006FA7D58|nr:lysozyme inhibitor LprI family protein [Duganella sp. Leaf126]KQQ36244.1 hypothetical protein ASF61_08675 [Duganella sp. Leaf126]
MSRPLSAFTFALVLVLGAGSAHARDCATATSTRDMNACAAGTQKAAEDRLNTEYQRVRDTLDRGAIRTQFVAAQRLWIKFREADCKTVLALYGTGSARTVMYLGCMQDRAETRTRELERFTGPG